MENQTTNLTTNQTTNQTSNTCFSNKTPNKTADPQRECMKCYMLGRFIEKCVRAKTTTAGFLRTMLEINYECCGEKFEAEFRAFVIKIFEEYSDYFLYNCTLDRKGFVHCMDLGTMLNYMTTENFDLGQFFMIEDCDSDSN